MNVRENGMEKIIEIHDLSVNIGDKEIIRRFDLVIEKGQKVAIAGGSGTGKTTLLHVLLGYTCFTSGHIKLFGKPLDQTAIHEIRGQTAWLPQELGLPVNTMNELLSVLFQFKQNRTNTPVQEEIDHILVRFGLTSKILNQPFTSLSGGQKQRAIMASCILIKKPLLILDEPTSTLDSRSIKKVTDYIMEMKDLTVISTSHNQQWLECCDKTINLGF